MKAFQNLLKIPYLPETATDEEIEAARKDLCKLQGELREFQKKMIFYSKILYDKYDTQKRKKFRSISITTDPGNSNEEISEGKSKEIVKDLSVRKESLIRNQVLLEKVD